MSPPDFSPLAARYARSRPRYPDSLITHVASLVEPRELAWDCATGSGQCAVALAEHFVRVVATDISRDQVAHAAPHPRVEYRVAPAEASGLDDRSVDLVTVASAVHWFNLPVFSAETCRVVRPGGALVVWSYHVGHVEPPFNRIFARFLADVLRPYFDEGARLVDERYATLDLPGEEIPCPSFTVEASWTWEQLLDFIASWSGTRKYLDEHGVDPVTLVADELASLWGAPSDVRTIRWPLYLRARRL